MLNHIRTLFGLPSAFWLMCISCLPGSLGFVLRYRYWKKRLKYLGSPVRIDVGVHFQNPDFISIDDNCWIDRNVMILAGPDKSQREKVVVENREFKGEPGVVHIGKNIHVGAGCIISGISAGIYVSDDCTFSAGCKIFAFSHHYRSIARPADTSVQFGSMGPHQRQCLIEGPVYFGKNTGVALNAVILPGVSIPDNCFVSVNSVVKPVAFTSNSFISGDPARATKCRFKTIE